MRKILREAALMGDPEAEGHRATARIGTSGNEFGLKDLVLPVRPAQHTT